MYYTSAGLHSAMILATTTHPQYWGTGIQLPDRYARLNAVDAFSLDTALDGLASAILIQLLFYRSWLCSIHKQIPER